MMASFYDRMTLAPAKPGQFVIAATRRSTGRTHRTGLRSFALIGATQYRSASFPSHPPCLPATLGFFDRRSVSQFPEKLAHVLHHQFGLLPKGEMASARHPGIVNQIEISRHHTLRRIEHRHFVWRGGKTGWHRDFAVTADGVIVAYRNRSADEIRDVYVSRLVGGRWTEPAPVHNDGWRIDGCPVNGPALSASGRDVAVAWFTAPNDQGHAFVAFSRDSGGAFGAPFRVDDAGALGRVSVELLSDGSAIVSWIELADRRATFMTRRIAPGGDRSPAVTVAEITARRSSNYPRMAQGDHEIVFAWIGSDHSNVQTAIARLP